MDEHLIPPSGQILKLSPLSQVQEQYTIPRVRTITATAPVHTVRDRPTGHTHPRVVRDIWDFGADQPCRHVDQPEFLAR